MPVLGPLVGHRGQPSNPLCAARPANRDAVASVVSECMGISHNSRVVTDLFGIPVNSGEPDGRADLSLRADGSPDGSRHDLYWK